ncbi:MAG: hypothetical protein L0387_00035 [Acidobacteria bacterium]|nr:hypothetical protein [Acidobacteriota bacterium]
MNDVNAYQVNRKAAEQNFKTTLDGFRGGVYLLALGYCGQKRTGVGLDAKRARQTI